MRYIKGTMLLEYELHLRNKERSSATIEKYKRDIKAFLNFLEKAGETIKKEKDNDKENDKENLKNKKKRNSELMIKKDSVICYKEYIKSKYAPASVNSMLAAINNFFEYMGWKDCKVQPLKIQKNIFCTKEKELTKAEYLRLIEAAKSRQNQRLALLMETICSTGIRISELIYITVEAVKKGKAEVRSKGKNRKIFLPEKLCRKLQKYIKEKKIESGYIFITKNGNPINRSNIWHDMKALCKLANVSPEKVFPHNLRHLFAITYYQLEKDLGRLADILGHSNIETTRIYTMTSGEEHEKQVNSLGLVV